MKHARVLLAMCTAGLVSLSHGTVHAQQQQPTTTEYEVLGGPSGIRRMTLREMAGMGNVVRQVVLEGRNVHCEFILSAYNQSSPQAHVRTTLFQGSTTSRCLGTFDRVQGTIALDRPALSELRLVGTARTVRMRLRRM